MTRDRADRGAVRAGRRIQAARDERGWSQTQLADALTEALNGRSTVSQSTVSAWESGESVPTMKKWPIVEQVLELQPGSLSRFYGGETPTDWQQASAVPEAISGDPFLTPEGKEFVLAAYRREISR